MGIAQLDIINRLKDGNQRFQNDQLNRKKQDLKQRKRTVTGQDPFAIVLSCADSRVVPELIFDTGLGELFVVRVAGNIANTSSIASIEYAVAQLGTKLIVVLGHQHCGAVTAAIQGGKPGKNLEHLLQHIQPAIEKVDDPKDVTKVIRSHVKLTVKALADQSSIIKNAIDQGVLEIIPAYYQLDNGKVIF